MMEAQQPTVNISQEKKKCSSSFNVFPMWSRVSEAEQQKKKCSSSSPDVWGHDTPSGWFSSLPSCLFLKYYHRMSSALSWGDFFIENTLTLLSSMNLFQTQRHDGHGSRWNVGMEMYDKHGLRSPFLPLKSFQLMLVCKTSQSSPLYCLIIL